MYVLYERHQNGSYVNIVVFAQARFERVLAFEKLSGLLSVGRRHQCLSSHHNYDVPMLLYLRSTNVERIVRE